MANYLTPSLPLDTEDGGDTENNDLIVLDDAKNKKNAKPPTKKRPKRRKKSSTSISKAVDNHTDTTVSFSFGVIRMLMIWCAVALVVMAVFLLIGLSFSHSVKSVFAVLPMAYDVLRYVFAVLAMLLLVYYGYLLSPAISEIARSEVYNWYDLFFNIAKGIPVMMIIAVISYSFPLLTSSMSRSSDIFANPQDAQATTNGLKNQATILPHEELIGSISSKVSGLLDVADSLMVVEDKELKARKDSLLNVKIKK